MPTTSAHATPKSPSSGVRKIVQLEQYKDALVDEAENLCVANPNTPQVELLVTVKLSQLQNLRRLSQQTTSIKEITSFVAYQIGRDAKKKTPGGWAKKEFGKKTIAAINKTAAKADVPDDKIEIVRLFLGYVVRAAVAHGVDDSGDNNDR